MATIYREILVKAPADFVWDAIKDVGAVHTRFVRGLAVDTVLNGDMRTITFANGFVLHEKIIAIDDKLRRLAYSAVGGRASHHNASFQVFAVSENETRILWITDLQPDEARAPIEQMVELGMVSIRNTLELDASANSPQS